MEATIANGQMWIVERYRAALSQAGLSEFEKVMTTTAGRCLRVLADRENWYLRPEVVRQPRGMYLKKHRVRTIWSLGRAAMGLKYVGPLSASPRNAGRVEAENALALESLGIPVVPLAAYGEKLQADGRLESFLLTEELDGYCELQEFIVRQFQPGVRAVKENSSATLSHLPSPYLAQADLRRLIVQVADIARRFHAAGFNHRDFYSCHFLVKETSPRAFDVRLIDLQRVQHRTWFRRRWIVKDLAQLARMLPDDRIGCREKILFLRSYLGVRKLRRRDKALVRRVLGKLAFMQRRARHGP